MDDSSLKHNAQVVSQLVNHGLKTPLIQKLRCTSSYSHQSDNAAAKQTATHNWRKADPRTETGYAQDIVLESKGATEDTAVVFKGLRSQLEEAPVDQIWDSLSIDKTNSCD